MNLKFIFYLFFTNLCFIHLNNFADEKIKKDNFRFSKPVELGITFDDFPAAGPESSFIDRQEISNKIIKSLKDNKIPDVYGFINGILLYDTEVQKKIFSDWKNAGYLLANHTFSHLNLSKVTAEEFIKDIEKNDTILIDYASTINELKVFRYPYLMEGDTLDKRYAIRSYFKKRNYKIAQVSVDSGDWYFNEAFIRCKRLNMEDKTQEIIENYIKNTAEVLIYNNSLSKFIYGANRKIPQVLLVHYNSINAFAMNQLIDKFKKMNVVFIPAAKAFNDNIFQEDSALAMNNGTTYFEQIRSSHKIIFNEYPFPKDYSSWLKDQCQK